MSLEKSAGALIFHQPRSRIPKESDKSDPTGQASSLRGENKEIEYLLLHYPSRSDAKKEYWDLPKGHIEKGEEEIDTVRREVKEETGLENIEIIDGFKKHIKYFFKLPRYQNKFGTGQEGKTIFKIVTFYLAESKMKDVKISHEHIDYKWLPYDKALEQLTFENAKEVLRQASQYLKTKN